MRIKIIFKQYCHPCILVFVCLFQPEVKLPFFLFNEKKNYLQAIISLCLGFCLSGQILHKVQIIFSLYFMRIKIIFSPYSLCTMVFVCLILPQFKYFFFIFNENANHFQPIISLCFGFCLSLSTSG